MRALVLGASSLLNLASSIQRHSLVADVAMVIVDPDTQSLRRAGQSIQDNLKVRPALVRAAAESVARYASRVNPPFDMVYTLGLYDRLAPEAALDVTREIARLLRPGGVLLTGCYMPTLPAAYRALAKAFVCLDWNYWDEAMWRDLLAQLPFDATVSRFDRVAADTLIIAARRSREEL